MVVRFHSFIARTFSMEFNCRTRRIWNALNPTPRSLPRVAVGVRIHQDRLHHAEDSGRGADSRGDQLTHGGNH